MPTYPFFSSTYQPIQPVYQPTFQNYTQPGMQQGYTQQNYTQSGIIWVSGEQEAQSYPVGPNAAVALWDSNGRTVDFKARVPRRTSNCPTTQPKTSWRRLWTRSKAIWRKSGKP